MVAAFGNLDVGGVFRRRENSRRKIVIQIRRKRRRARRIRSQLALDGGQDIFELAGSHQRIDFGNLLEDLIAIALNQASGHDQFFGHAEFFVFGHFQNRVDRFFLRRGDEAARIDDQDVGFFRARRKFIAVSRENAHHHLAIHEVFRATQADESCFWHRNASRDGGTVRSF